MKTKAILFTVCLLVFATMAAAQNTIKLFDPVAISWSDPNVIMNSNPWGMYRTAQVFLTCPNRPTSSISGPNGSDLIVDNLLMLNDTNICRGNCFSLIANPAYYVGMPVETAYLGVGTINVSRDITTTGLYTFHLIDTGFTYGNTGVYLNTSCWIMPVYVPEEPLPNPGPTPTPEPTPVPPAAPTGESVICHRNNGSAGSQTLTVGASAVAAHLAHGDTLGACGQ